MRDVMQDIIQWQKAGKEIVMATVVKAYGSALRPVGSKMVISSTGNISGSVSGGCVETAVFQEAQGVFRDGKAKLVSYGIADETAWSVGLTCGGTIKVFFEYLDMDDDHNVLVEALQSDHMIGQATVISGSKIGEKMLLRPNERNENNLSDTVLAGRIYENSRELFRRQSTGIINISTETEDVEVFIQVYPPSPRLIVVGAVHIAIPLVELGNTMGFRTVVVDPRSAFLTRERFPAVDEMIKKWPSDALEELQLDEGTYVAVLSHDAKFDVPALKTAVESNARYVGVLASKDTYHVLHTALLEEGVSEDVLEKIHTPIGIKKLGARGPEGIAFSIIAEMIAEMRGVKVS